MPFRQSTHIYNTLTSGFVTIMAYSIANTGRASNLLACFDLLGNILWEQAFSSNLNEDCYLKDLRRTPDGGFIMGGYAYTSTPQKGYLMKTDSLGRSCSWLGCDSVAYGFPDGVLPPPPPSPPNIVNNWQVYSNPAQHYLTISNLSTQQNATFGLCDLLGHALLQQTLSILNTQISTEHLPLGVYLYHLLLNPQKQTLQYGKISIMR